MFEVLGLLLGGVGRIMPELFKFLNQKKDADHEYRMTELQLKIDQARAQQNLDEIHARGAVATSAAEMQAMIAALQAEGSRANSGIPIIDALNASVRPIITYWWCLVIYTVHKGVLITVALEEHLPLAQMAPILMNNFDRGVVGSIIGFWFVDRALRKIAP